MKSIDGLLVLQHFLHSRTTWRDLAACSIEWGKSQRRKAAEPASLAQAALVGDAERLLVLDRVCDHAHGALEHLAAVAAFENVAAAVGDDAGYGLAG